MHGLDAVPTVPVTDPSASPPAMARILLVDPSETARRALQGILARGSHRLATVDTPAQAWSFLRRNPGTDLLFTGLQLAGAGNGLDLIQRLRADPCLQHLPVVVYTSHSDRSSVKSAIDLHVQNFLVKPYHDDDIFAEIDKAETNPWRDQFFEEEKSFCRMMRLTPEQLHEMMNDLLRDLQAAQAPLAAAALANDQPAVAHLLSPLLQRAEAAGVWIVFEALTRLSDQAGRNEWGAWSVGAEQLDLAIRMLACRLDPGQGASPDFYTATVDADPYERERLAWLAAPAENRCPVMPMAQLLNTVSSLRGCPVIDTAAAAFQMMANGHPSSIAPLMDLVARDPGLTAQVLIATNRLHPPGPGENPVEDARLAVGQLGEVRLEMLARTLAVVPQSALNRPPHFDWPRYWTFLRGVARVAQIICRELDFASLEPAARAAAQLHDIGTLVLAHLYPAGFQAILEHARKERVRLFQSEKLLLGCTSSRIGAHFAEQNGLPPRFVNVIRGIDDPAGAPVEDRRLVAIVSLARKFCRHNGIGTSGDPPLATARPVRETVQWEILSEGLYPSFDLPKFENQIHVQCQRLRAEFSGHQSGTVAELVAAAASAG